MKKIKLEDIIKQSFIAAIYVVLSFTVSGIAYGPIQFRYSEILNLLALFNPLHSIGVTLGVFIFNIWSLLGWFDIIFGTLHTAISLYFISKSNRFSSKSKNLLLASIWPTAFSFIIGFELSVLAGFGDIFTMTWQVMLSEFIIMTLIAVPIFALITKNDNFLKSISCEDIYKKYKNIL